MSEPASKGASLEEIAAGSTDAGLADLIAILETAFVPEPIAKALKFAREERIRRFLRMLRDEGLYELVRALAIAGSHLPDVRIVLELARQERRRRTIKMVPPPKLSLFASP